MSKIDLSTVEKWLTENNYEFKSTRLGDNEFNIPAVIVTFYFDGIGNSRKQEPALRNYLSRLHHFTVRSHHFGAGYTYRITTKNDRARLDEYTARKMEQVEQFWQDRHAALQEETP